MKLLFLQLTLQMILHFFTHITIGNETTKNQNRQHDIWDLNKHSYTQSEESSSHEL